MKYNINLEEGLLMVEEPAVSMGLYRTKSLFERHNRDSKVEDGVPLHEGFEAFRKRLIQKHSEKENSFIS